MRAAAFTSAQDAQEKSLYPWAPAERPFSSHATAMLWVEESRGSNGELIHTGSPGTDRFRFRRLRARVPLWMHLSDKRVLFYLQMLGVRDQSTETEKSNYRRPFSADAVAQPRSRPLASARERQRCRRRRRGRSISIRGRATLARVEALLELVLGRSEAPCQLRNGCSSKEERNEDDQHNHAVESEYLTKHLNLHFPVGSWGAPKDGHHARRSSGARYSDHAPSMDAGSNSGRGR